jgi:hypothetical protein
MPPRLTLRNGLSMQDEGAWRDAVLTVTRAWRPFTVRLGPPEVLEDRMLSLTPVGDTVSDLQHALGRSLIAAGFAPRTGDVADPVLLLAGTFTGVTRSGLHELGNAVRSDSHFRWTSAPRRSIRSPRPTVTATRRSTHFRSVVDGSTAMGREFSRTLRIWRTLDFCRSHSTVIFDGIPTPPLPEEPP